jgi:hypothetical protein
LRFWRPLAGAGALLALVAWGFLPARAGDRMTSSSNDMARSGVGGGGASNGPLSTNFRLDGGSSEEIAGSTFSSTNFRLGPGFVQIFAIPGAVTALTSLNLETDSTINLQWTAPGVDGPLGTLAAGSSYYIRVASYTVPNTFALFTDANVVFSTSGVLPSTDVSTQAVGLIANTSYFAMLWTKSPGGDLSYPMTFYSTGTTLATAPTVGALEFLSVQRTSVTVAWIAFRASPPDVSSMSNEGYTLEASSNNFGALAPAGAPVFSSTTFNVLNSTLSVGVAGVPLDLSSTYYFRVASLNHQSKLSYTSFTRLNFQILQSTGLIPLGAIDPDVTRSSVSTSSMVIVNLGNWPVTVELAADFEAVPAVPWALSTSPGDEIGSLMGVFKPGVVEPLPTDFSTFLTPTFRHAGGPGGNYAGTVQNAFQIPQGQSRTMWFKFTMPNTSASLGPAEIRVTTQPLYP